MIFIPEIDIESNSNFSNLVEVLCSETEDFVFIMDKNCRIVFANQSVTEQLGYEITDLNKMKLEDLFSPKYKEFFKDFENLFPKEGYLRVDLEFADRNGELIHTRSRNSIVCDSNNEHRFLVSINKNIEKEKSIKEAILKDRLFLEAILDITEALVFVLNTRGEIVRFNNSCKKLTGYSRSEVLGKEFWDYLIPEDEQDQVREVFESQVKSGFPLHQISHWKTNTGEKRLIEWSNTILEDEDGNIEYFIGSGIDIT